MCTPLILKLEVHSSLDFANLCSNKEAGYVILFQVLFKGRNSSYTLEPKIVVRGSDPLSNPS